MSVQKYLNRPTASLTVDPSGKYERFNLRENPFPSSPFVNPESTDVRSNGAIYEESIRQAEYDKIQHNFLSVPQSDPNHLRLGYIQDESYVGRGNGKSAFIVHVQRKINEDFGLTVSSGVNKSFAVRILPESGGKTKTFESLVDLLAAAILRSTFVEDALASMRLEAILSLQPEFDVSSHFENDNQLRSKMNSDEWFRSGKIDIGQINQMVVDNPYLNGLPPDFPLFSSTSLWPKVAKGSDFVMYYDNLKRGRAKYDFVFSHLVAMFLAAGFNGTYVFVDDFERVPEFQSERQKRDFAVELRSCLFDGLSLNARVGFYNFLLVLHAGIPRLMQGAWEQSGLEHRAPMFYKGGTPKHIVRFEKITLNDTLSLLGTYLNYYRIVPTSSDDLVPFSRDAVLKIAEISELNAARTLKLAYEVLERAVENGLNQIEEEDVLGTSEDAGVDTREAGGIHDAETKNLYLEAE